MTNLRREPGEDTLEVGIPHSSAKSSEPLPESTPPRGAAPSSYVGSIRLDQVLGQGAMGTVWAGFDEKLRRDVAVKTFHSDRVTVERRARLLVEARILSQLEVPGICRLYDYIEGDESDYLILELLRGRTLRQLIADEVSAGEDETPRGSRAAAPLELSKVLRIGEELAEALAAAHGRGVIHRDLKPANIMLVREDGDDVERVKVLDFGIAQAVTEATVEKRNGDRRQTTHDGTLTRFGSLLAAEEKAGITGTPAYMSPEQAQGEAATAASDIYSLGLTLQELATGRPAYPTGLPLTELMPRVAAGATLPLDRVDGALRALIEDLKALAPEDRPTAREAVRRFQRIRKRPQRLRRIAAAVTLATAALFGGVKYTLDLRHERNRAVAAEEESQEVTDFLTKLFTATSPTGHGPTGVQEFLALGVARIDRLAEEPIAQARILHTLGSLYVELYEPAKARPLLERALDMRRRLLGERHPAVAATLYSLSRVQTLEEDPAFEETLRQVLALRQEVLGNHPDTLATLVQLASLVGLRDLEIAGELWLTARTMYREIPDLQASTELAMWLGLANFSFQTAEWGESEDYRRQALGVCDRDPDCSDLELRYHASNSWVHQGRPDKAQEMLTPALETARELYGEWSWPFGMCLMGLAEIQRVQGDLEAAAETHRQALAIAERHFPEGHNIYGFLFGQAARLRGQRGDLPGATAMARRSVAIIESTIGGPSLTRVVIHLADLLRQQGDLEQAAREIARAYEHFRQRNAGASWQLPVARSVEGAVLSEQGRRAEAEPLLRKAFQDLRQVAGDRSPWTLRAHARLVDHYVAGGQQELAAQARAWLPEGDT